MQKDEWFKLGDHERIVISIFVEALDPEVEMPPTYQAPVKVKFNFAPRTPLEADGVLVALEALIANIRKRMAAMSEAATIQRLNGG